jgi:large repetitive protein
MHLPNTTRCCVVGMAMLFGASGAPTQKATPLTQQQIAAAEQSTGVRPLLMPTDGLPPAYAGMPFHSSIMLQGGVGPYNVLLSGDLPPGITYEPGMNVVVFSGVPTSTGTFNSEITVIDADGEKATHPYTIDVRPISNVTPPPAVIADPEAMHINDLESVFFPVVIKIAEAIHITDGMKDFSSARVPLPEAVHINDTTTVLLGAQYGLPEAIHINDATSVQVSVGILPTTTPAGHVNVAYSQTFTAAGNKGPATLTPTGALPTGMSFTGSGSSITLSGTPTIAGTFPFTIKAQDSVSSATTTYSLVVAGASQIITIGTLPTPTYGGAPFSVSATSDSGLPVTITELSGPATGTGNGPYTATAGGVVNFQATQAGNTNYSAATPVNFSVTIAPAAQTITIGTLPTPTYGGAPFSVSATSSSGLPVTITELSGPATGSGDGPYTATASGTVNFQATQAGNASYAAATPVNFSVNIGDGTQTITIGTLPTPTYGGAPFSVSATSTSGLPVTITELSGPATGSGNGPYTATGAGVVNFQATQAGNTNFTAATPVNFSVTIASAIQTITVGTIPTPVYGGAPFSVSATSTSGLPVTIAELSGPATGSGNGPYTATGAGVVNFRATQAGNTNYAAATPVNFSVTIGASAQTITIGALPTPTYGGTPFSVSATSSSGLPVTITELSGPATGSGNGPYTATGSGVVNFQATQTGNANFSAATPVNFSVNIGGAPQTITIGTLPTPIYGGTPFSVSATSSSGLPVTITEVSGPVTGSGNGPYTATGAGVVNFQATQAGNAKFSAATPVNFKVTIAVETQTITIGKPPTPTYGSAFTVSATSSSNLPVTITEISGPATGSGNGPFTTTGAGVVNFQATQAGNTNFTAATPVNFSVTVGKQNSLTTVSANPATVTPIQSVTLTANVSAAITGSPTGTVTFFDNNVQIGSPVAIAGGQAQLTVPLLSGTQSLSATYSGDANFLTSTSTNSATVNVAPLDFTMTPLSPVTLSVEPGAAASVSFNVTPLYVVYPGPVSFSLSGLPPNATYTITPTSIAATGGPLTVAVTITTAPALVKNSSPYSPRSAPIALALFLPLLALGTLRRRHRWISLLLLVMSVFAGSAFLGCAGGHTGNGFFGQEPKTYAVLITATSGTVQHTINVNLQVQ